MPNESVKPTKFDAIIKLLKRPAGATIAQLKKATGWKPHSVRAALTGLRKKGHKLVRDESANGVTIYRVAKDAA